MNLPNHSQNQWVEISVGDTSMPVYACTPLQEKPKAAILVFQEAFGVNSHIRSVAERIASLGYIALAPDLFHRQGHRFETSYDDIAAARKRAMQMSEEQVLADIDRVIATLDDQLKVGAVGFCMGGRIAFQTSFNPRLSAVVSYYGSSIAEKAQKWASHISCPLLFFFGEKDEVIPPGQIALLREILHEHSKDAEVIIYPGAEHGFFCEERSSYHAKPAQDSWERFKRFLITNL